MFLSSLITDSHLSPDERERHALSSLLPAVILDKKECQSIPGEWTLSTEKHLQTNHFPESFLLHLLSLLILISPQPKQSTQSSHWLGNSACTPPPYVTAPSNSAVLPLSQDPITSHFNIELISSS